MASVFYLPGAAAGSIVSTRLMLVFTAKYFGDEAQIRYDREEGGSIPAGIASHWLFVLL